MSATETKPKSDSATAIATPNGGDLLMWVGNKFYPTKECFISEAFKQGISKRIKFVPKGITPGTRVFLAHKPIVQNNRPELTCLQCGAKWKPRVKEVQECAECRSEFFASKDKTEKKKVTVQLPEKPKEVRGEVFGFFYPNSIEYIIKDPEQLAKFKKQSKEVDVKGIEHSHVEKEELRGCGKRQSGGLYLVAHIVNQEISELVKKYADDIDLKGSLIALKKPVALPDEMNRTFVGFKYVNGNAFFKHSIPYERKTPIETPAAPKVKKEKKAAATKEPKPKKAATKKDKIPKPAKQKQMTDEEIKAEALRLKSVKMKAPGEPSKKA